MPGKRSCVRRLRDGQGRPSHAVHLAAHSGELQLVDEGEKRVGLHEHGVEEGNGLPGAVSAHGLDRPLQFACLLVAGMMPAHFTQIHACSFFSMRDLRCGAWDPVR